MPRYVALALALLLGSACATPKAPPGTVERIPSLPPAEECGDVPLLSLEHLRQGEGADQRVAVDGVPRPQVICTLLACDDGTNCCNACGGEYLLADTQEHRVQLAGLEGCRGSCPVECLPFGVEPRRSYRFVGTHRFQAAGQTSVFAKSVIEIERMCRLSDADADG